jgi:carboxymethylenebutenolidase
MSQSTHNQRVDLNISDGTKMSAYVSSPEAKGPHPGLIVLQEAFGVNSHIRNVADRFAAQGYVAIAPELYHRTAPGFEGSYTDFAAIKPHMQAMTIAGAEADLQAAFDWLQSQPDVKKEKIFSVGFCMGGRMSFLANTILPLDAAVSFYGGGITGELLERVPQLRARMLFFWGGLDKHIPPEQRRALADALTAAGKTFVNVEFSNADHGFSCDERSAYQPEASRQAWALMLEFLRS